MFLPDETQPCVSFYNGLMNRQPHGCIFEESQKLYKNRYRPRVPCKYNHGRPNEPPSALIEIYKTLDSARESVQICMYLIMLQEMVKFLIYLKVSKNIKIQIIINSKCELKKFPKREMKHLRDAGIVLKTNNEGMMHNKFAIVDSKILISGSVNWTYTAFKTNDETIMITSQSSIVEKFKEKFEQMWEQMDLYEPRLSAAQINLITFARGHPFAQMHDGQRDILVTQMDTGGPDSGADSDDQSEPSRGSFRITRYAKSSSREDMLTSSEADVESGEEGVITVTRTRRPASFTNAS